jgi:hypothetical protein
MSALAQIQAFIRRKTEALPRMLTLHGKIEMAKRTLELKRLHKGKKTEEKQEPLTYVDAEDAEDAAMESEESEEEIEQIPIGAGDKRKRHADAEDQDDIELDDSVSGHSEDDQDD